MKRNIIIEHNVRDEDGNPTGELPIIMNQKEGWMDDYDFNNLTEGNAINEPSTWEHDGVCPKTKQDVIYNRTLIITDKTDAELINEYKEMNNEL